MKIQYRLFHKTLVSTLLLFACIILISHLILYFSFPIFYKQNIYTDMENHAHTLQTILENNDFSSNEAILKSYTEKNNINLLVEYNNETYQYNTNAISINTFIQEDQLDIQENNAVETILLFHETVTLKDGSQLKLQFMQTLQPVKQARTITLSLLPFSIGISFCISCIFAYLFSKSISKPIEEMVHETDDMQKLKVDAKVQVKGNDEIASLATHINALYSHLLETIQSLEKENAYVKQMENEKVNFFRAASHDLKTPLANTRIMLENMQYNIGKYQDHTTYLQKAIDQIDTITNMLQTMLQTTKQYTDIQTLSIKENIETVLQKYATLIEQKQIQLQINIEEYVVEMNAQQLQHILTNLISNALFYTTGSKKVSITLLNGIFTIENECKPIQDTDLCHIFEPFYRIDKSRNLNAGGNGLGLYIVKNILESMQLKYAFESKHNSMSFWIDFKKHS